MVDTPNDSTQPKATVADAVVGGAKAVGGTVQSYLGAINIFHSLNVFRQTENYRYNEERLQQMSPVHREAMIQGYNDALGIPNPDAFEKHIKTYLKTKSLPDNISEEEKQEFKALNAQKDLITQEVALFTQAIQELPANTHAETLSQVAKAEQNRLLVNLQKFDSDWDTFTTKIKNKTPAPDAAAAAAATAASDATTAAATPIITAGEAGDLTAALGTIGENLANGQSDAFNALETNLTSTVTEMHRAAQLERGRIPLLATLTANKRKLKNFSLMSSFTGLFTKKTPSPDGVVMTGQDQTEIKSLRKAMQKQDLSAEDQASLEAAQTKIKHAKSALAKATENGEEAKIKQYKDEIEAHQKTIKKLQAKGQAGRQAAANTINELTGYDPGFKSLSGQKITVSADDQGLGFSLDFPRAIFDPGFYTSSEHNTKADLVCLAELVRASGAKNIEMTVNNSFSPDKAKRLAREAWESALETGFSKDQITINMNGQLITEKNIQDILYTTQDKNQNKQDKSVSSKFAVADQLADISAKERAKVTQGQVEQIKEQQNNFTEALENGRAKIKAKAKAEVTTAKAEVTTALTTAEAQQTADNSRQQQTPAAPATTPSTPK